MPIYRESIKYIYLKSYGKFKMCPTCATYTDLSFLIADEIAREWVNYIKLIQKKISKQVTEVVHEL